MGGTSLRRAQGRLLLRPNARTIRWPSFVVIASLGALVVWTGGRKEADPATIALPIATTLLCMWLCFLFEDVAAETTAAAATPLRFRRAVRTMIVIPAAAAAWFGYTWIGPLSGPTAVMLGSFGAQVILALAVAAVAARLMGPDRHGFEGLGVVAFIALVLPVAVGRPPSVDPAMPPFGSPLTYWSALALASMVVLVLAHLSPQARR